MHTTDQIGFQTMAIPIHSSYLLDHHSMNILGCHQQHQCLNNNKYLNQANIIMEVENIETIIEIKEKGVEIIAIKAIEMIEEITDLITLQERDTHLSLSTEDTLGKFRLETIHIY